MLVDTNPKSIAAVQQAVSTLPAFRCISVVPAYSPSSLPQNNKPNLVLINLDAIAETPFHITKCLNRSIGLVPSYIGLTTNYRKGFDAFKQGFINVIDNPYSVQHIERALLRYHSTAPHSSLYCINYYYDFRYLQLDEILFLQADGYTTEFVMLDGTVVTDFNTLKHTHAQLPYHFQRIHRSFVVNAHLVNRINMGRRELYLRGRQAPLPVSRTYYDNLFAIKEILSKSIKCYQNPTAHSQH
jgi:DNA-binding LytR/AlgR family response regulator